MYYPANLVQGELENHQVRSILVDSNYKLFDTNGKVLVNYNKKYIMVIDSKPFKLNNYEETIRRFISFKLYNEIRRCRILILLIL